MSIAAITKYFGLNNSVGNDRSTLTRKNIFISLILKPLSVLSGYLFVPVALSYLDPGQYGIWLTLTSILGWLYLFDMGIGLGMRNNLAKALTINDEESAKIYISTSYAIITLISCAILIIFLVINKFLNWSELLNTPSALTGELNIIVLWLAVITIFRFIFSLINTVFNAIQKTFYNDVINFIISLLSLIIVFLFTKFFKSSLLLFAISTSLIGLLILFIATIWFFGGKGKYIRPSFKYIRFKNIGDLVSLGLKFFILQIGVIVIFATDNIIISHLFGPEEVTKYNIAFKYLNSVGILSGIFLIPLWSAYTNAYESKDFAWIENAIKKNLRFFCLACILIVLMILVSDYFYSFWIGKEIDIPFNLTILMGVFVLISLWNNIFVFFLNGVSKIKLQLYITVFITILNIPLAILFAKYLGLGIAGVILSTIVCLIPSAVLFPIQYSKIIQNKAKGIFDK